MSGSTARLRGASNEHAEGGGSAEVAGGAPGGKRAVDVNRRRTGRMAHDRGRGRRSLN